MLNLCSFIGRLGADPEIKSFSNGNRVANIRLAVTESWREKSTGEKKEKVEWVSGAIFSDGLIGVAEKYLRKGGLVYISGKLTTRKWQDSDGKDRYSTEIVLQGFDAKLVMLGGKSDGSSEGGSAYEKPAQKTADSWVADDLDDDQVPF